MSRHTDSAETQVEFSDVHGVECGTECCLAGMQDILCRNGIVDERELRYVHLRRNDVLHHGECRMVRVGVEEDVLISALHSVDTTEDRDRVGAVAISDVVLRTAGQVPAAAVGRQDHVGGVDVRAMLFLGQSECRNASGSQSGSCSRPCRLVVALPHRPETEDGHLPRVPVVESVEAEDLGQRGDTAGIPALVGVTAAVAGGRQKCGEQTFLRREIEEIGVEDLVVIVGQESVLSTRLEPVDGRAQQSPRGRVELRPIVRGGMEQQIIRH